MKCRFSLPVLNQCIRSQFPNFSFLSSWVMGIPGFFRWLSNRYPSTVTSFPYSDAESELTFDNLYLDLNGIVHQSCETATTPAAIVEAVFDRINDLISLVRPQRLLFLALDGVAPRAKMNQQRTRRYKSAKERAADVLNVLPSFDRTSITPGTIFMMDLSEALHLYVQQRFLPRHPHLNVVVSDSTVPGEGEHKVMEFIRQHSDAAKHLVVGMDADLIMLGLATHQPQLYILREILFDPTAMSNTGRRYQLVHLPRLRKELSLQFNASATSEAERRCIEDWITLCFLLGNDFMPSLPIPWDVRDGAVDQLTKLYQELFRDGEERRFLTHRNEIHLANLECFMSELGRRELTGCPISKQALENISSDYKESYYISRFSLESPTDLLFRSELVFEYTSGLAWMLRYYCSGVPSWSWFYPFHYAPFPSDFSGLENLAEFEPERVRFTRSDDPVTPLQQLMAVLPPTSSDLVPGSYAELMQHPLSPIRDFYPVDFNVDTGGRRFQWQGTVILPYVHLPRLRSALNSITLSPDELARNRTGQQIVYSSGETVDPYISALLDDDENLVWRCSPDDLIEPPSKVSKAVK